MDLADDFVVDEPLTFCYFLEGKFAVNIFRFGSNYCPLVSPSLLCLNFSGGGDVDAVGDNDAEAGSISCGFPATSEKN